MFRYLLVLLCWVFTISAQAQKLTVEGMTLASDDQSASTEKRLDVNGGPCALVKVKLALKGVSFGGNVITPVDYRDGEYWVYLTEGSYLLQVKHPDFQPLMVNFRDHDVSKVVPLKTYRLTFAQPPTQTLTGTLQVNYEPAGSEVFLDGMRIGVTPLIKKGISPGSHKVVVKKSSRVTEHKDIIVTAGESSQLAGVLKNPELKDNMTASEWTAVGIAYAKGVGLGLMTIDIDKALECLQKAADMEDVEAMVNLGMIYERGIKGIREFNGVKIFGTPKWEAEALKWYRKASDLGDAEGQALLGNMYFEGKGNLPKDYTEAATLLRKAAEQNNAIAQRRLGVLYMVGDGVKEDPVKAVEWFQKAADQEDGEAQKALGKCYDEGIGVPADKKQALYWYKKASNNRVSVSKETLERLNTEELMTDTVSSTQELTIEGMELSGSDLSASTDRQVDDKGKNGALVKVQLAAPGAQFEGNIIAPAEFKNGEYWVFMPDGSSQLTIKMPNYPSLTVNFIDYAIDAVRSLTTYELAINVPSDGSFDDGKRFLKIIIEQASARGPLFEADETIAKQYRMLDDVKVYVDDQLQELHNGRVSVLLNRGKHTYRVEHPDYAIVSETIDINDDHIERKINLKKNAKSVTLTCPTEGAKFYVHEYNELGTTPCTVQLETSTIVRVSLKGYRTIYQRVELNEKGDHQTIAFPALEPIEGTINVDFAPAGSNVFIDGNFLGTSPGVFKYLIGNHTVEIRKDGYLTEDTEIYVLEGEETILKGSMLKKGESKMSASQMLKLGEKKKDKYKAAEWYRKAAEQGNAKAQCLYGQMLESGHGARMNCEEAVKWYTKSAEQGNPEALFHLGHCYYYSWGVNKNLTEALSWYKKAAARGHIRAKEIIQREEYREESRRERKREQEKRKAAQLPTFSGDQLETFTVKGVSFNMVRVDGGTFQMGATSEQENPDDDEKPVHQVTLFSYYIGETEVTQALWEAVMYSNPSKLEGSNKPVEQVSWNDCQAFVKRMSSLTGKNFRLPTEAEWEFAARGGNKSRGYQYCGSNNVQDVAWFGENCGDKPFSNSLDFDAEKNNCHTHDVKTKQPNELGLYDMSGNVDEWCQDRAGTYSSSAQTNPTGPSTNPYVIIDYYVLRGGSWRDDARSCRVANRGYNTPDSRHYGLGLRLVLK